MKNFFKILVGILFVVIIVASFLYLKNSQTVSKKDIYMDCELGDLVGDDVKRIKIKNYNVDYHTEDFSQKQVSDFANECLSDGISTQFQMDCCMTKKMYPEK